MKKYNGKILDCVLFFQCLCLLIVAIPKGLVVFIAIIVLTLCFFAIFNCRFFR